MTLVSGRVTRCRPGDGAPVVPGRHVRGAGTDSKLSSARRCDDAGCPLERDAGSAHSYPTTNVGTLPPPALTLMTELREARVTAPASSPAT